MIDWTCPQTSLAVIVPCVASPSSCTQASERDLKAKSFKPLAFSRDYSGQSNNTDLGGSQRYTYVAENAALRRTRICFED